MTRDTAKRILFSIAKQPYANQGRLILGVTRSHTQWHTTVSRTPPDEGSACRRDLYLTPHDTHETDIHAITGIRTCNPSKRAAADSRHRRFDYWNRHNTYYVQEQTTQLYKCIIFVCIYAERERERGKAEKGGGLWEALVTPESLEMVQTEHHFVRRFAIFARSSFW